MKAVLLSGDLMVLSRVEGAAATAGAIVRAANSPRRACELCEAESAELLIVDLASCIDDLPELVGELRTRLGPALRIVAFGPHVHEDRLAAARAAGCDSVVSRGKFFSDLESLFQS